ncbi:uncharacterized protein LOC120357894 isoform X2 [Solenopsis invicta]|uniref:uncharacterized protein LOC120357894 isoform X2 n=1 Tax=Solenopsis invicta TaxID=13686 RepID=UPI00193D3768|nr:uncharacterized protein LOC120357894 isoform X2 [Solenopsis invicta]
MNNYVMTIVKNLLAAVLLLLTSQGVFLQDNETVNDQIVHDVNENRFRLRQNVVPIHYDIKLIQHIVDNNFTTNGETNIDVDVRESTNDIELHVLDLTIDESLTKLIRKGVDVNSKSEYVPKQHLYNVETQILTLRFEELLDPVTYTLHFTFTGVIRPDDCNRGLFRRLYINDKGNKAKIQTASNILIVAAVTIRMSWKIFCAEVWTKNVSQKRSMSFRFNCSRCE